MGGLRAAFAVLAVTCLTLFVIATMRDTAREWKQYQRRFYALEAEHGRSEREKRFIRETPLQIRQIVIDELGIVDRCTTCHLAVESSVGNYEEQPFRRHPTWPRHLFYQFPFDKYGCTICHEGQGRATSADASHGRIRYWDRPLLRGSLIQSACLKCHDESSLAIVAPLAAAGQQLYRKNECWSCHRIGLEGASKGPELTTVGLRPLGHFDFSHVRGPRTIENWHVEHLMDPKRVMPATIMPNYELTDNEAKALTIYLLGLTGTRVPQEYVVRLAPPARPTGVPQQGGASP